MTPIHVCTCPKVPLELASYDDFGLHDRGATLGSLAVTTIMH